MFSRYDRDRLAEVISCYLNDELTAFAFDERLTEIASQTKDGTVEHVATLFWNFYDDIEDHKVVASKEDWDYFQRLLLILKSDAHIVCESCNRKWTPRQAVAALCLIAFVVAVARSGFGSHLFLVTAPLGLVSLSLWYWRARVETRRMKEQIAIEPFRSVSELLSIRRRVHSYRKVLYPARMRSRRIRGPVGQAASWLHVAMAALVFSPVILLFQMLPEREQRWRVVEAQPLRS